MMMMSRLVGWLVMCGAPGRDSHAELSLVKDEVRYTTGLLDTCQAELAAHYQDWLRQTCGAAAAEGAAAAAQVNGSESESTNNVR